MNKSDLEEFTKLMFGVADTFGSKYSDFALEIMFKALKNYSLQQIEYAAIEILKTRKYTKMPTVADFIQYIDGNVEDIATVEAVKVWNSIGRFGAYSSVVFNDTITMAVIERGFGGWITMCEELKADERKWFVREFEKIYKSFKMQNVEGPTKLAGIVERDNMARGFLRNIPLPVHIDGIRNPKRIEHDKNLIENGDE